MHLEILVEDISGRRFLDKVLPAILGDSDTYKVIAYKGIGRLPKDRRDEKDPAKRILLHNLPRLLKGYGRTFHGYPRGYECALVIVCDLDDRDRTAFLAELQAVLDQCNPKPALSSASRSRRARRGYWVILTPSEPHIPAPGKPSSTRMSATAYAEPGKSWRTPFTRVAVQSSSARAGKASPPHPIPIQARPGRDEQRLPILPAEGNLRW